MAGKFLGHSLNGRSIDTAELCVFSNRLFFCSFQHQLQTALHPDVCTLSILEHGVDEQITYHGFLVVIGIKCHRLPILQGHKVFKVKLLAVLVCTLFRWFQTYFMGP